VRVAWRGAWLTALLAVALGVAWVEVSILKPTPPSPWATAPDLEPVAAVGSRVVLVLIDGMNAARAFDPGSMPFLAGQRAQGAWGIAQAQVPTLTGSAVTTLGTGRWTTLLDAIYNFQAPPSQSDSVFRRLDDAGRRAALIGDSAWASRFGPWADVITATPDHGIADTHSSDEASGAAFEAWLEGDMAHPLVVMHWVGADHAGHGGGSTADSSPYTARLRELDAEVERLWAALAARDPAASMLVISDHGMTAKGGHGGGEEETRNAPFVWWGPGIGVSGPLALAQAQVAPSVAAYLGVPPPAEAAQPVALALFGGMSAEYGAALTRNGERQRRAVTTDASGEPMPTQRPGRAWAVAALVVLGVSALGWAWRARALVGVCLGASAPMLRWWGGHLWVYGALLAMALWVGLGWRRGSGWAVGALALTWVTWAGVGPLVWTERDVLGVLVLLGVVAWGWARASKRARGGLLIVGALAVAQRLWPLPLTAAALLLAGLVGAAALARRGRGREAAACALLVGGALYGDGALAGLWLLSAAGWALANGVKAAPVVDEGVQGVGVGVGAGSRLLWVAPLLVVAWEVLGYFALGKDYSLSAVQVALAFTLDAELSLGWALGMVALGEALPWAVAALLVRAWGGARAVSALGAVLVGRLALLMGAFGLIERSFWLLSSTIPYMIGTWVLAVTWPLVVSAWGSADPLAVTRGEDMSSVKRR
jgi:hypothetical protein